MNLLDRKTMQAIVETIKPGGSFIGEQFFPIEMEPTEESIWDIVKPGEGLASLRAADGEARLMQGKSFDRKIASITDMAAKRRLNVSDIRAIREAGEAEIVTNSLVGQMKARAEKRITRELGRMRTVVENRLEWARINALMGGISYVDATSNIKVEIDYGIPADQKDLNPSVDWDIIATSNPLGDIQTWIEKVTDLTGIVPTTAIMSRKALYYAAQSTLLRAEFKYTNSPLLTASDVQKLFLDRLGLNVLIYEARYFENNTAYRFLPVNKLILVPDVDSLNGIQRFADTAVVPHPLNDYNGSFYVWNDEKKDPWGIEVGVGLTALPRIYQPETILTADLWD